MSATLITLTPIRLTPIHFAGGSEISSCFPICVTLTKISVDEIDLTVDINQISLTKVAVDEIDLTVDINQISLTKVTVDEIDLTISIDSITLTTL